MNCKVGCIESFDKNGKGTKFALVGWKYIKIFLTIIVPKLYLLQKKSLGYYVNFIDISRHNT